MTRVGVRSAALLAAARALDAAADDVGLQARALALVLARCRPPPVWGSGWSGGPALAAWARLEARVVRVLGPDRLGGEAPALELLGVRLRGAARGYEQVESAVAAVMRSVAGAVDLAARGGLLDDGTVPPVLRPVPGRWRGTSFAGPADLVAAGEGLEGGRVRVVEVAAADGGSAWVVVLPGTQEWSPVAGANPFDLTTDVRAVAGEDPVVAAAGVVAALDRARAASGHSGVRDPVLLVGHSQGGILAAALAADPTFTAGHRVTHVVTTGSPVGLFPVPTTVRVLSVEHADDPVPGLDLTPNPERPSWLTLRVGSGPPLDVRRHALTEYVRTTRAAAGAPAGSVAGLTGWTASAGGFLGRPVRSVTEVVIERGWQNPRP